MANYKVVDADQLDADLTTVAEAIREKTGGTEHLSFPEGMVSEMDAVFEAGKKSEYDAFWDTFQNNGNRTKYVNGFDGYGFNRYNFYPKYDITPEDASDMFSNWNTENIHSMSLKERMKECGVKFDFSETTDFTRAFYYVNYFTELPELDMSMATLLNRTFAYNYAMVTIEKLKVGAATVFKNTFEESRKIENLIIDGTIGQNGFNVNQSPNLTHESLMSIINALADYSADTSGTVWTVAIGSTNKTKLTEAELAIAENKGWVVA